MKMKKQIIITEIVNDIRTKMSDSLLIEKYRISAKGLQSVFRKLVDAQAIRPEELTDRMKSYDDTGTLDFDALAFTPNQALTCLVPVYDDSNPESRGSICEIQDNGFMVTGLKSGTGDEMKLVLATDDFFQIDSFKVEAVCKWSRNNGPEDSWVAAFEIMKISEDDRAKLAELVRMVRL
ncbi:MAG: hypothetical protein HY912_18890 [Desulfomonile tiedjei]|uniref:PilZ domain-containing protein n=1 Tax=Desulfomonile tiedjei TaxID=2358 RepID=A0A9D6Z5I6_9BACT|nr:hypothetical protein [Desulfomonile tiedjei]